MAKTLPAEGSDEYNKIAQRALDKLEERAKNNEDAKVVPIRPKKN